MNIVVERNLSIGLKVFLDKPIWLSFEQELCCESPNSVMSKRIVIVLPNAKLKMPWVILETNSQCELLGKQIFAKNPVRYFTKSWPNIMVNFYIEKSKCF